MTTFDVVLQALLEAGTAGLLILAALGGLATLPGRFRRAVNRAFRRGGF